MQQNIQTLGALERRIDLSVATAEIDKEVALRLGKLARSASMPGFRRGKVPMKLVAASYGAQVQAEVLNDKVEQALSAALESQKLRVAGAPRLEPRKDGGAGEVAFSATFEVYPEIRYDDLSKLEVRRATCSIGAAEVDKTLEIMRAQRGVYVPAAREARDGDRVQVDFRGTIDGTAFEGGTATDFRFVPGRGRMLPEFEAAVRGCRDGEQRGFELTFPADYPGQAGGTPLAGRRAHFDLTVKQVETLQLPAIDADFARALGVADGDLDRMRAEVRANLEREVAARLRARTRDSVLDALHGAAHFDLPRSLVEADQQRLVEMARAGRGAGAGAALPAGPGPEVFAAQSERRVRLGLLLGEIVKAHGLQARQEQVRKAIETVAQSYEKPAEVIQWYLGNRERLDQIESAVVEDNVIAWVLGRARVIETPVAFDELMEHAA
ncbi:MAG TPA: trigger factor [Burkholderiaceae bacterium]